MGRYQRYGQGPVTPDDEEGRQKAAVNRLCVVALDIAAEYQLCLICLIENAALNVRELEADGKLMHGIPKRGRNERGPL